jgi:hypothetical protein
MTRVSPAGSRARYLPSLVLLLITGIDLVVGAQYKPEARAMPMLIGMIMLVLLALDFVSLTDSPIGARLTQLFSPERDAPLAAYSFTRQAQALGWVVGLTTALLLAGIVSGVFVYVAGSMRFFGRRSWARSLVTAVLVTLFIWALFTGALRIPLYPGWAAEHLLSHATA